VNVPNFITLARLFAVPVIVWLIINNNVWLAFCLTVLAGISDALDGFIAKRFNCVTKLGTFLDPIADKALLVCLFIVLGQQGYIAAWIVILVVSRDLLIVGGALMYHTITHSLEMAPLKISKVNTVVQFGFIVGVLGIEGYGYDMDGPQLILQYIMALTTIFSGLAYVYLWSRKTSEFEVGGLDNNRRGRK
jgi:cardiolipin synthase